MGYVVGPWIYGDETEDKGEVQMNNEQRVKAIQGLVQKAERNNQEATNAKKQRDDAVALLAGKRRAQKPLRPGVKELLNGGR